MRINTFGICLALTFLAACTRQDAAKTGPGSPACKTRMANVVTYMRLFKDANVLQTDVSVPPDESKAPKALSYDAKRHLLECDAGGCRLGSGAKIPYEAVAKRLPTALRPNGRSCEEVYLAVTDTLPPAKLQPVFTVLATNDCAAFAVTRSTLKKLPVVEPTPEAIDQLKLVSSAKTAGERRLASKRLVDSVLKPHAKSCGKTQKFLGGLTKFKGYERFKKVMSELETKGKDFEACVCQLPGQDEKVVFQVAGFERLGGTLFVYSGKKISASALTKPLGTLKTWYDFVQKL